MREESKLEDWHRKCVEIYESNKIEMYWYLKKQYNWLPEEDVNDVMQETWKFMVNHILKVSEWKVNEQRMWLFASADKFVDERKQIIEQKENMGTNIKEKL